MTTKSQKGSKKNDKEGGAVAEESDNETIEEDAADEWGGIASSDGEGAEETISKTTKAPKASKKKKAQASKLDSTLANIGFAALNEADEEDSKIKSLILAKNHAD